MNRLTTENPPPDREFWQRVRRAENPLLALDFDGTLAPFHPDRMAAKPAFGVIDEINSILENGRSRLALVSGRPIAELDLLVGDLARRIPVSGAHGWEYREPGREISRLQLDPGIAALIEEAADRALQSAGPYLLEKPDERIERKAASVAAHVRGMDSARARAFLENLKEAWRGLAKRGLEVMEFDGGLEIRAPGRGKGLVIKELLERYPDADLAVYVGDDRTDEDAFRALSDRGVGVKVGPGVTAAAFGLEGPPDVVDFLKSWNNARPAERNPGNG